MSKPKPASSSSPRLANFSRKRASTRFASRIGRPAPTARRATAPSTRNSDSSSRRAPSPRVSSVRPRVAASDERTAAMSSISPIGSAKRRSARHGGRRTARVDRFLVDAERAIELRDQRSAEAGGKRGARRTDDLADALEADAIERGDGVMVEAKRGQRQWRQHRPAAAGRHHDGRDRFRNGPQQTPRQGCRRWRHGRGSLDREGGRRDRRRAPNSPPKRCAQPVMSSIRPCRGSSATSSV